jgi:phosphoglycerate kinase
MKINFVSSTGPISNTVLLRVDFNVALHGGKISIADDARIRQTLPTIKTLLNNKNRLIIISHLGRPKRRGKMFSLKPVATYLDKLLPGYSVNLVSDFRLPSGRRIVEEQRSNQILMLENIRFYEEEKKGIIKFAQELSRLGEVFVNDAFGVMHRADASVVGIPKFLPSFGGLLLKTEIEAMNKVLKRPKKGFVAIIGGTKVDTKISLIGRLEQMVEYILLGGRLANAFICAKGHELGRTACSYEEVEKARRLLFMAKKRGAEFILPDDVVIGHPDNSEDPGEVRKITDVPLNKYILDIGPNTQAKFATIINQAKTVVWNGPVGYFENPNFKRGSDFIYYAIAHNPKAYSVIGGGDTISAISQKEYIDKITHISTGGGAMLEYIEKGSLPGIEVLKR